MTAQLTPTPVQKFWDANGVQLSGGKVFTYIAGTTTKQATWTDSTQSVLNTNPIILNARGEAPNWLDTTETYKEVVAPANDTDPPTSPIQTSDNINAPGTSTVTIPSGLAGNGVSDDSAAINNAINTAFAAGGGTVFLPPGKTYAGTASLLLQSNVQLSAYGATYLYTGNGNAVGSGTSGVLLYSGISGLTINGGTTAAKLLALFSSYFGSFKDIRFLSNSTTNTCLALDVNTAGPTNPSGNYNTAYNLFDNVEQETIGGGNGCGTFISMSGSDASHVTTLNTFNNVNANLVNVIGIDENQWCDSNVFTGMCRINLSSLISPANGIGCAMGRLGAGVYAENFQFLAIDTFGAPAVDNRRGLVANYGNTVKFLVVGLFEFGPAVPNNGLVLTNVLSSNINQAPRGATNYQSMDFIGTNLGVGLAGNVSVTVYASQGAWLSGASQYVNFAQGSCYNTATALGASYAATPGAAGAAGAYTVAQVMGFYAASGVNGANATVTTAYGFFCADQNFGGTNNYGFYSNVVAGAGKFAFYGAGTAPSFFNGDLQIPGAAQAVLHTLTTVTNGAGAGAGTLTNAPAAGNPTKWIPFNDAGTTRYFPSW